MKLALKILGIVLVVLVLVGAGALGWASVAASSKLSRDVPVHAVDFPVPFPLTVEEMAELEVEADTDGSLALARALERGRHLVEARYGCKDCHGADFGGGVMVDAFPIGTFLGPNITSGAGSATVEYTAADWDRIVRHGVKPDGTPSAMPSQDFARMSDQELSDIVTFINSLPPVDHTVEVPVSLGPVGRILVATGSLPLASDLIGVHDQDHLSTPPPAARTVEFGGHLASTCAGCHGPTYAGGPIPGGDPSWPPAANLTPHADGLAGWSYDDFVTALRDATRPDGTPVQPPMTFVSPLAAAMTDVELEALWLYLQSLPPEA